MDRPYLRLEDLEFLGRRWMMATTTEDLCIVLTCFPDGRRVAIRQVRPGFAGRVLGPPMGAFPQTSGVAGLDYARAEAQDEVGYRVAAIRFAFSVLRSPGLTNQRAHVYAATLTNEHLGQSLHSDEDIEVVVFPSGASAADVLSTYPDDHVDASFWYYFLPEVTAS